MSPIVDGRMYAEIRQRSMHNTDFKILLLGPLNESTYSWLIKKRAVDAYLQHISAQAENRISLYTNSNMETDERAAYFNLQILEIEITRDNLKATVKDLDVDLVVDLTNWLSNRYIWVNSDDFMVARDLNTVSEECEAFLLGNGVSWSFDEIVWNHHIISRYFSKPGLSKALFDSMSTAKNDVGLSDPLVDRIRHLSNRSAQIEYAKDLIKALLIRKRKGNRNELEDEDFSFELNYHLSNYYFLISGALDMYARLINETYQLGLTQFRDLNLEKTSFLNHLIVKRPSLYRTLNNEALNNWIKWLKDRRNYIAHDAALYHTSIVEPNPSLSDEQIRAQADEEADWDFIATIYNPEQLAARRAMVEDIIRVQSHRVIHRDVMMIPGSTTRIFKPLNNIDYDFRKFVLITQKIMRNILKRKFPASF